MGGKSGCHLDLEPVLLHESDYFNWPADGNVIALGLIGAFKCSS